MFCASDSVGFFLDHVQEVAIAYVSSITTYYDGILKTNASHPQKLQVQKAIDNIWSETTRSCSTHACKKSTENLLSDMFCASDSVGFFLDHVLDSLAYGIGSLLAGYSRHN